MATAQDTYRAMVKNELAPGLRELGFKGSGRRYELPSPTHWALLGLQASAYSDRAEVRFTANLLVVSREVWTEESERHKDLGTKPNPNTHPGRFAWWERIGVLMPNGRDTWWRVGAGKNTERVAREVLQAIELYGLPALRAHLPS